MLSKHKAVQLISKPLFIKSTNFQTHSVLFLLAIKRKTVALGALEVKTLPA
jgi:hypothetical protein